MPVTPATPAEVEQILSFLADTPLRIAAAAAGRADKDLARSGDPKAWSAGEIIAHLRGCSDVWGETIRAMLAQDCPELPAIRPREWVKRQGYTRRSFGESFDAFERARAELLDLLRPLPFADWDRSAMIGGHRNTIFSQAQRLALHEVQHCEQIEELLLK